MQKVKTKSYAKVNLYLRLLRKRSDGYNDLVTVYQKVSLFDEIEFCKVSRGFELTCDRKNIPSRSGNLIYEAYRLMKEKSRFRGGLRVNLQKNIPMKAGLGGASSNAAEALQFLNAFYNIGYDRSRLMQLGAKLGSDVPFFLSGASMGLGLDRGEKVSILSKKSRSLYLVLFCFSEGLSTPKVYQKFAYPNSQISLTKIFDEVIMLRHFASNKDVSAINKISYNDLLVPAGELKPEIISLIRRLKAKGFSKPLMTGSGATVFSLFHSKKEASQALKRFSSEKNISTYLVKTI